MALIADCGSCWTKLLQTENGTPELIPSTELLRKDLVFDLATGHLGRRRTRRYENELLALACGGLYLIDEEDFTIVDVGARDAKYCHFCARKLRKLDWNQSCGAATGFALELVARHFDIDYQALSTADSPLPVTCGVFGIERIFDAIALGAAPSEAVARFVRGVAFNVFDFAQRPDRLYLSGGLCLNNCFVASLREYCEAIPLGRFVLLHGLQHPRFGGR